MVKHIMQISLPTCRIYRCTRYTYLCMIYIYIYICSIYICIYIICVCVCIYLQDIYRSYRLTINKNLFRLARHTRVHAYTYVSRTVCTRTYTHNLRSIHAFVSFRAFVSRSVYNRIVFEERPRPVARFQFESSEINLADSAIEDVKRKSMLNQIKHIVIQYDEFLVLSGSKSN